MRWRRDRGGRRRIESKWEKRLKKFKIISISLEGGEAGGGREGRQGAGEGRREGRGRKGEETERNRRKRLKKSSNYIQMFVRRSEEDLKKLTCYPEGV